MKYLYKLSLLFIVITTIQCDSMKQEQKYEWGVDFGAAPNFPAELYLGYMEVDGEKSGVVIRGEGVVGGPRDEWGYGSASTELMPLPKKLHLIWMSFVEDQFYEAHIDLDTLKIKELFEKGYPVMLEDKITTQHEYKFFVNVAPGGTVAVWLSEGWGDNKTEVGFYPQIAQKTDVKWKDFNPMGLQDRKKYVQNRLNNHIPDSLQKHYKTSGIPFDRWEKLRKKYTYNLLFKKEDQQIFIDLYLINGEKRTLNNPWVEIDYKGEQLTLALPIKFRFAWREPNKIAYEAMIEIPEEEREKMTAFFEAHNNIASLYIEPYIPQYVRQIRMFLISGDDKIEIKTKPHEVFK